MKDKRSSKAKETNFDYIPPNLVPNHSILYKHL